MLRGRAEDDSNEGTEARRAQRSGRRARGARGIGGQTPSTGHAERAPHIDSRGRLSPIPNESRGRSSAIEQLKAAVRHEPSGAAPLRPSSLVPVPSPWPVADDVSVDDDPDAVRHVLERVAVEDRHVTVLAHLQRADAVGDAEDLRGVEGDRRQRVLEAQPVGRDLGT